MKRLLDEVMPKKQQPTNPTIVIIDLMSEEEQEEEARSEKKTENLTVPSAVPDAQSDSSEQTLGQ